MYIFIKEQVDTKAKSSSVFLFILPAGSGDREAGVECVQVGKHEDAWYRLDRPG